MFAARTNSASYAGKSLVDGCSKSASLSKLKLEGSPRTIDELMRIRAKTEEQYPLVSYPHQGIDYVDYSADQLDQFAYNAAKSYSTNIATHTKTSEKPLVVALLGPSSLDYLISMLAISKLGHTTLHLSTRISHEAYVHLLRLTDASHFIVDESMKEVAFRCQADIPHLQVQIIATAKIYDCQTYVEETNMTPMLDPVQQQEAPVWIIHSGGSTGLPKPIFISQRAAMNNYAANMNMRAFITSPLFHAFGICNLFRAIYARKQAYIYNARIPLTKRYLIESMQNIDIEAFFGVPYSLEILAEEDEGIKVLAKCKAVVYSGAACPDEVGDKLVANGVQLTSHWGSTETGGLMNSTRPKSDKNWNWMRPIPAAKPFIQMEPRGDGLYEAVCLPGWPSKVVSNRPDGSYAMKDLFLKHIDPTKDWWKYYGRLDDTIVLVNGEKAMPLEIEGAARQHRYVTEAVVFGKERDRLGLAIIRSPESTGISDKNIAESVVSDIEEIQLKMPAYARISSDMVLILNSDTDYPKTDKNTVIRIRFYKHFEDEINSLYESQNNQQGTLQLNENELKSFIRKAIKDIRQDDDEFSDTQDLFNSGMDSLQATQLRAMISKHVDLGGKALGINVAFEYPSIENLAQHIYSIRTNSTQEAAESVEDRMASMIAKYSNFRSHEPVTRRNTSRSVVLTGITGSLGAHIAHILALDSSIEKIYCLVRASSPENANQRIQKSFQERKLPILPPDCSKKFIGLPADLSQPDLGLEPDMLEEIKTNTSSVIHSAWSVNFSLSISSFEDCIAGAHNLMQLCLDVKAPNPATFCFCSSVSTVMRTSGNTISESIPPLSSAQSMGYAQSKLSTEHICQMAADKYNLPTQVLRIGQIVGDLQHGIWNKQEAIPLMLQSARTIGALPTLNENVRWLAVDTVAQTCIDIALRPSTSPAEATNKVQVYNILNPQTMNWTSSLLPMLKKTSLNNFVELPVTEWLERLRSSNQDPVANPPIKLLDFWTAKYGSPGNSKPKVEYAWETSNTADQSEVFRNSTPPTFEHVNLIVKHFQESCW